MFASSFFFFFFSSRRRHTRFDCDWSSDVCSSDLFGHLLRALHLGAPPHGGIAFGLDRLVMLIAGEQSIRDVIAFPKNNRGMDLMSNSPAEVDARQLQDLSLKLAKDKKP